MTLVSLSNLLDRASAIESTVAEIYDQLARRFEHDQELLHFWSLMAEAERYHALLIHMLKLGAVDGAMDAERLKVWDTEITETMEFLGEIFQLMSNPDWTPSVNQAFELAHGIEVRSFEVQAHSLELFTQTPLGDLVSRLHNEDQDHRNKLLEAQRRFTTITPNSQP